MIEIIEAIDEEQEILDPGTADSGVTPPAPAPVNSDALAARITANVLNGIRGAQAPVAQTSALQETIKGMIDEGVPQIAIERIMKLRQAERLDEQRIVQQQQQVYQAQAFDQGCWQIAVSQLADYSKNIPVLAKAKEGLKNDLLQDINDLIASDPDPDFAAIRNQVATKRLPDASKVGKAVAKVVDAYLLENGLSKKVIPQELKNSKVDAPSAAVDMNDFDKGARQIYAQVLKHTGDEQKALKRARDLMAGK